MNSKTLPPLHIFTPIYFEKVWGGHMHATFYNRIIPQELTNPIGESWELSDRPEACSHDTVTNKSLHDLWTSHRQEIFGTLSPETPRFPLLVKIIDASEHLSLQVHPPATLAASLGGEPKTEMWYFLHCRPGAIIFAGFAEKISKEKFLEAATSHSTEQLYHKIHSKPGDAMFIPSGRVHAIGAGNLLLEVQQNSDTTYRVDDWGRLGLDGKPRELHLEHAIQCIDFDDVRPELQHPSTDTLVQCPLFSVSQHQFVEKFQIPGQAETFVLIFNQSGVSQIAGHILKPGDFALLPAHSSDRTIHTTTSSSKIILTTWGK